MLLIKANSQLRPFIRGADLGRLKMFWEDRVTIRYKKKKDLNNISINRKDNTLSDYGLESSTSATCGQTWPRFLQGKSLKV